MIESEDIKRPQLLETILDSSPNCIYVKDKQGRYILANKTIADLYRTTPDEMIGKKDEDFADQAILKPNEAAFFKDIDKKAIETKETQTIPCESFTYEDGTIHYFFTTKTPIIYQDDPDCVMGISVDITKLKETEKQASENESKFQDIFNKSTTGYSLTKADGTLSEVNNAFASMLGYTVEELSQMNFEDITHPDDMAKSKECVKTLLSGAQDSYRLEKRYFHKNGSIVWTDVSTTIMKDRDDNPLFFITSIQNITEKKDSSEKLKQNEKKFKTLFNSSSDALFIHSLADEKIIDVNEETLRRYGYTKNEILGLTVDDLSDISINSTKSKETQQLYQKLLDGETIQTDWCSKKKNGETFWHQITLKIVTIDGEKRLLVQAKDIDEMVHSRNKLAESEKKYRSYIDNAPNGVFICDEKGRYLEVNDKAVETTGYSKDELLTMSINDTIPDENKELGLQHFQNLLNEGKSFGEAPFVHKDGTVRWWQVNAVKLAENRLLGFTQDITDQKRIELELIKAKQRLEDAEKTARIGNVEWYVKEEKGYWSDVIFELYEQDPSLGVPPYDEIMRFHHPDDAKQLDEAVKQAITQGIPYSVDLRTNLPSGKESIYHAIGIPIRDETGEVSSIKGTVQDVTNYVKAEQESKKYSLFLDRIMEESPFSMWIANRNGTVIKTNQSLRKKLNLTDNQIVGKYNVLDDENLREQGVMSQIKAVFQDQKPTRFVIPWSSEKGGSQVDFAGGSSLWIDVTLFPIADTDGKTEHVICQWIDITDRKRFEEELKKTSEHLKKLISASPSAIITVDTNGNVTSWNPASEQIFGWNENEVIGKFNPTVPEQLKDIYFQTIKETRVNLQHRVLCKDGSFVDISLSTTPLFDDKGNLSGALGVMTNITKQKQAEQQAEKSRKDMELLLKSSSNGIRVITKDFKVHLMNQKMADIAQTTAEKGVGMRCSEMFPSRWCGTDQCSMKRILRDGTGFVEEDVRKTKDGEEISFLDSVTPYYDEQGDIIGIIEDFRDITSLKRSQDRFRNIFENKGTAMGMFGDDGVITICNSRFEEISGFTKEEIHGKMKWSDFVVKEDLERMMQYHRQRSKGGDAPSEYECGVINKQGEKKTMIINIGVMPNSNERIVSLTDITKQKTVEKELLNAHKELKELNKNLEKKVEDRTAQIQLLLDQKDEFINQLGHDIKNPLGPLVNLLPLLEKNETNPERKEMIQVMNRNVAYIKNLVTRTIQLAQLKSPSTGLNLEEFDLGKEIKDILGNNQLHFDDKQITVENNIPEKILVTADKLKIQEVFNNLLNNAVKYNKQQGTIIIDQMIENDTLTISIKDTGVGMKQEQLKRVFDEFYKADSSRHDFDSSGLGMAITKRIIEMHEGKIWAESEGIDRGSTFYFTLPKLTEKKT